MVKDIVSKEVEELMCGINDFKAYSLLGINGQPRFAKGQEFFLTSSKSDEKIKFSVDNIVLNKIVLKSMKKFPEEYFSKNEQLELLALNEKVVNFTISEVSDKKLTIFSSSYKNIEKEE